MPHPKKFVNSDVVYVSGHVRRKRRKSNISVWLVVIMIPVIGFLWMMSPWVTIGLVIYGFLLFFGVSWLQWRIWRIETHAKQNYWVYLLKGKS